MRALSQTVRFQLEREIMLDTQRNPVRSALSLLKLRQSTDPYLKRRIGAWTEVLSRELLEWHPETVDFAKASPGHLLPAVLAASGHEVSPLGPAGFFLGLVDEIRTTGVGVVSEHLVAWLEKQQTA